jgi:catechol 2,3-dioxygenase-like lactoylglutathione lyase family enzyme
VQPGLGIRGVYEVVVRVRDLERAFAFYRDVLGCELGLDDRARGRLFLRAGGLGGMVVLLLDPGEWPQQHFAFTVGEEDLEAAAAELRRHGVETQGPVFHEWMPARSLYFSDPDGHDLELCAPGPEQRS